MFLKYVILIFLIKNIHGLYVNDGCLTNHDGSPGICTIDFQCPRVLVLLRYYRIRPTICGFERYRPVVCCPFNQFNPNGNNQIDRYSERISARKCREYKRCGNTRRKRQEGVHFVVGGLDTYPGEYPHMAAIGWVLRDGSGYGWYCGGSLISEQVVLTAAHCTYLSDTRSVLSHTPNLVRLGANNIKIIDVTRTQDLEIVRIVQHPRYRAPYKYNDIALLGLRTLVRFSLFVRPICLWQTQYIPTDRTTVTGWGKVGYGDEPSDTLQQVEISIIDTNTCNNFYQNYRRYLPNGIINEQICAGDPNGGKDTCQGDSGGPLQIKDSEYSCSYHLIGITSFGVGCGGKDSPAVYTRISPYIDWIESLLWSNEI